MKKIAYRTSFLSLFVSTLFFSACLQSENHQGHEHHEHGDEHQHEHHEGERLASLTEDQMQAVDIQIGNLEQKALSGGIKANGFLTVPNSDKANATSMFGGVIQALRVEMGQQVKKGQVIAQIANPDFIRTQEEYLSVKANLAYAQQELDRQNELSQGNVGARKNLEKAESDLNTLRTRLASLGKQITMMGINPDKLSPANLQESILVLSPISGVISTIFTKIGSYTDASSPIAEIIKNSALHLDLQVYEKDIHRIETGQKLDFTITNSPEKHYTAEVYSVGASFSGDSKTIAVHCRVLGDKTGLIDGMNITAQVNMGQKSELAIPDEGIVNADGKYYIFIRHQEDHQEAHHEESDEHHHDQQTLNFERIEVFPGASELGYTAITPASALPNDAQVVIKGAYFVNAKIDDSAEHAHSH